MKHSEWLLVGAKVSDLWPSQSWPPETMAAAYELFEKVPQVEALAAVGELFAEGREFAPAPAALLARTMTIVVASTPALADPDLTRELTDEERDRARKIAAALTGSKAKSVVAIWLEFTIHANACKSCGEVARRCRRPGMQSSMFPPMLRDLCVAGRPLFEVWRYAVDELRMAPDSVEQQEIPA